MSDPLDYMNAFCQWDDPPKYDEKWAKTLAAACEIISDRDATIEYLTSRLTRPREKCGRSAKH